MVSNRAKITCNLENSREGGTQILIFRKGKAKTYFILDLDMWGSLSSSR